MGTISHKEMSGNWVVPSMFGLQTLLGGKEDRKEALGGEDGGTEGEKVGAEMQKEIDTKGYKLVVTGHSLGAGAAALISLKLRDNFEGGPDSALSSCKCRVSLQWSTKETSMMTLRCATAR